MPTHTSVIADHADYRVELVAPDVIAPAHAGKLLVGFGPVNSGLDDAGFGEGLAEKIGVAYLGVKQRKNTQYQFLSRDTLAEALSSLREEYELFFYGSSVGAYCAAYFARPLGAHFLALSPRIPVHPITRHRISTKFPNEGYEHDPIYAGDAPETGARHIVMYDPDNAIDRFYVSTDLAAAYDDLEIHETPNAGHYTARALMLSKSLKGIALDFLAKRPLVFELDTEASVAWHENRFYAMLKKRKLGLASENLEVLMRNQDGARIAAHTRALNAAAIAALASKAPSTGRSEAAPPAPVSFRKRALRKLGF